MTTARSSAEDTFARAFDDIYVAARAAWAQLDVDSTVFRALVETKVAQGCPRDASSDARAAQLRSLNARDLYLACACASGDTAALAAFDARYGRKISEVLRSLSIPAGEARDELRQLLQVHLFVARDGAVPNITKYSGRGSLARWLQVTLTRMALRHGRRSGQELPAQSELFDALPDASDDPEMKMLKRLYRDEFAQAFGDAVKALSPRERNVLRHQLLDRLSIDEIGALYRVHRATAARWLLRARESLVKRTQQAMMRRLQIQHAEYESILRLIRSRLDLALSQHFQRTSEALFKL